MAEQTANPTTLIASGLTGTTYSNTGLSSSTTYYYVVKALDSDGTSAASAQATATTPVAGVVAAPTSLTAVGSSSQQVDLRWVPSATVAPNTAPVNYSVYRSTTTPFTPSAANLLGTTIGITSYVDNNYPATLTQSPTGPRRSAIHDVLLPGHSLDLVWNFGSRPDLSNIPPGNAVDCRSRYSHRLNRDG